MSMKLYPPKGGDPVIPHPTKIDYYLDRGWTYEPPKKVKPKTKAKRTEN